MQHFHDEEILFLGPGGRGGVSAVLQAYSTVFSPFKIIHTHRDGGKMQKLVTAAGSMAQFVWRLLTDRKIKVVHAHGASRASFYRKRMFLSIARFFGKKTVFHCHGAEFKMFYGEHPDDVRKTLGKVDAVVALSDYWKDFFESIGCRNVIAVKNPVPAPRIARRPYADGAVHFVLIGEICERKGCFDIVSMADRYHAGLSGKVVIHLAGNGEGERLQSEIERLGLGDVLKYEGWADPGKKAALLNAADVYLLPSHNEGVPISILEAMTYGLPVISTPAGGIPSVVFDGDNGLLVPPSDPDRLFSTVSKVASDPALRTAMSARSRELSEPFLIHNVRNSLDDFYNKLLS